MQNSSTFSQGFRIESASESSSNLIGNVGENELDKTGDKLEEVNVQDTQHEEQQEFSFVCVDVTRPHPLALARKACQAGDIHVGVTRM